MDLDRQIIGIQKSTRTLFSFVNPLHNKLRMKYPWYYFWHTKTYTSIIHWTVLVLFLPCLTLLLGNVYYPHKISAESQTCGYAKWNWVSPAPTGSTLRSVYIYDENNIWIAGDAIILKWNSHNSTWENSFTEKTAPSFNGISGVDKENIWTVGSNGLILKYNGYSWFQQESGTTVNLNSVYALDKNNVWAVGDSGTVLKYNGSIWQNDLGYNQSTPTTTNKLTGIHGDNENNVWAVGSSGTVLKYSNGLWLAKSSGVSTNFTNVNVYNQNSIWIAGGTTVLHSNGEGFNSTGSFLDEIPGAINAVYAISEHEVYAAGRNFGVKGIIYNFDFNNNWYDFQPSQLFSDTLVGISGKSSGTIVAVGSSGQIYTRKSFSKEAAGVTDDLKSTTGLNSDIWVVGNNGTILTKGEGDTWQSETSDDTLKSDLNYVTNNGTDIWAVGDGGTILKRNNQGSWEKKASDLTTNDLHSIYSIGDQVWAVGNSGAIISTSDGENWQVNNSNSSKNLYTVYSDGEKVWAAGAEETILEYGDSLEWSEVFNGGNAQFSYRFFKGGAFLYGDHGEWAEYSGGQWSVAFTFTSTTRSFASYSFDGASVDYFVTDDGTISKNLHDFYSYSGVFNSVYAQDQSNIWFVGDNGTIIFYDGGYAWNNQSSAVAVRASYTSLEYIDNNQIYAAGQQYFPSNRATVVKFDGASWSQVYTNGTIGTKVNDISALTDNGVTKLWGVGPNRRWYFDGENWTETIIASTTLNAVSAIAEDNIWAVGSNGIVMNNWVKLDHSHFPFTTKLNGLAYINDSLIWLVGDGGKIYKYNSLEDSYEDFSVSGIASNLTSIVSIGQDKAWAVGANGTILEFVNGIWVKVDHGISEINSIQLNKIDAFSQEKIWAVGNNGVVVQFDGSNWSKKDLGYSQTLNAIDVVASNNVWVIGNGGKILNYQVPENSTATKLIAVLPGENFISGDGVTGQIQRQKVGLPFSVSIHATDNNNTLDQNSGAIAGFLTDGNYIASPNLVSLASSEHACGSSQSAITFTKPGNFRITPVDQNSSLSSSYSSEVVVEEGDPFGFFLKSSIPATIVPGSSLLLSLGVKDMYDNVIQSHNQLDVNLSTNSNTGRFSASPYGPWSQSLQVSMLQGNLNFYYLDYKNDSQSVVTATSGNLTIPVQIRTETGGVDQAGTLMSISSETASAGSSVDVEIKLSASDTVGKTIKIFSSRGKEVIKDTDGETSSQSLTDNQGIARFKVSSEVVGSTKLFAYDESDNVWIESQKTLTFLPDKLDSIVVEPSAYETVAGSPVRLSIKSFDKYKNPKPVTSYRLQTSDKKAEANNHVLTAKLFRSIGDKMVKLAKAVYSRDTFDTSLVLKTSGNQIITAIESKTNLQGEVTIAVKPAPFSSNISKITSTKNKVIIKKDKAAINIFVSDQYSNPLPEKEIAIEINPNNIGKIEPTLSGTTDASGILRFDFYPNDLGKVQIRAKNKTDGAYIDGDLVIEVISDTPINNLISIVDSLQNSPVAQKIAEITRNVVATTATLSLIPIIANIIGSAPAAIHFVTYGFSLALEALGIRKRRRSWGRVYDSATGKSVDMALVRLFNQETMKLEGTIVTDPRGRFAFNPPAGNYVVSVAKEGFCFPTSLFAKYGIASINKSAARINSHYVGQTINVTSENNQINLEIPIDNINTKPNLFIRFKIISSDIFGYLANVLPYVIIPLLTIGFLMSAFTAVVLPSDRNMGLFVLYTVIALGFSISKAIKSSHTGVVYDSTTKKPIEGAVVSIFDKKFGDLKETRTTDKFGRFSILAQAGTYYLRVVKEQYVFPSTKVKHSKSRLAALKDHKYKNLYFGDSFELKSNSYINFNVPVDRKMKG